MFSSNGVEAREKIRIKYSRKMLADIRNDILCVVKAYYNDSLAAKLEAVFYIFDKYDWIIQEIKELDGSSECSDDCRDIFIKYDCQSILMMQHILLFKLKQEKERESLTEIFYIYQNC